MLCQTEPAHYPPCKQRPSFKSNLSSRVCVDCPRHTHFPQSTPDQLFILEIKNLISCFLSFLLVVHISTLHVGGLILSRKMCLFTLSAYFQTEKCIFNGGKIFVKFSFKEAPKGESQSSSWEKWACWDKESKSETVVWNRSAWMPSIRTMPASQTRQNISFRCETRTWTPSWCL